MACASDSSQAQIPARGTALAAAELMLLVPLRNWGKKKKKKYPSIIYLTRADLYSFVFSLKGGWGHHVPGAGGTKRLCLPRASSGRRRARGWRAVPAGAGGQDALGGTVPRDGDVCPPRRSRCWVTITPGGESRPAERAAAGWRLGVPVRGTGMDGGCDRVPGVEHPPASPHVGLSLLRRAEVILGNILKKKGWRYWTAGRCSPQTSGTPGNRRILLVFKIMMGVRRCWPRSQCCGFQAVPGARVCDGRTQSRQPALSSAK